MIKMFCDGASKGNPGEASIGVYAEENGEEVFSISLKLGIKTNNFAEWTSLIEGLKKSIELKIKEITIFMDSELVVKQFNGEYKTKHPDLIPLKNEAKTLAMNFQSIQVSHVRREFNKIADKLANKALE